ncbi:hypothetical protein EPN44_07255 [bacterium]|nr:MAG: hypothetical protein EPN44_07255 [bacterium]
MRHSHATLLRSRGVNPKGVHERLGRSNVQTTLNTNGHVLPTAQRAAVAQIGEALGRTISRGKRQNL